MTRIITLTLLLVSSLTSAVAQSSATLQTTSETTLYAGPGSNFGAVGIVPAHQQIIIIPPKSVIIGKGVTIGQGVLIEGKPWHQVQLPDGRKGFLSGSLICSPSSSVVGTMGLCVNR